MCEDTALLGNDNNGHWNLGAAPTNASIRRRYLPGTLILETEIEVSGGIATVGDFMPLRREGSSHLVRLVQGHKGTVELATELVLRFDYGSVIPWVTVKLAEGICRPYATAAGGCQPGGLPALG